MENVGVMADVAILDRAYEKADEMTQRRLDAIKRIEKINRTREGLARPYMVVATELRGLSEYNIRFKPNTLDPETALEEDGRMKWHSSALGHFYIKLDLEGQELWYKINRWDCEIYSYYSEQSWRSIERRSIHWWKGEEKRFKVGKNTELFSDTCIRQMRSQINLIVEEIERDVRQRIRREARDQMVEDVIEGVEGSVQNLGDVIVWSPETDVDFGKQKTYRDEFRSEFLGGMFVRFNNRTTTEYKEISTTRFHVDMNVNIENADTDRVKELFEQLREVCDQIADVANAA